MQIDELMELVKNRRSIRKFRPETIPDEYIQKILETARWAMSGANGQPWEFLIIKDNDTKKKLAEAFLHYHGMQMKIEMTRMPEYRHRTAVTQEGTTPFWEQAPVVIAVLGDMRTMLISTIIQRLYEQHTFDQNMANVTQMIHLAAYSLGLGTQWLSLDPPRSEAVKQILGIPPEIRLFNLVPIGYPAYQKTGNRRNLAEMVHYEKYDISKMRTDDAILEFVKNSRKTP